MCAADCVLCPCPLPPLPQPTGQFQYRLTITGASLTDAEDAAEMLYDNIVANKPICDPALYGDLNVASVMKARADARAAGAGTGRRLLQTVPTWCTTLANSYGAPAPFPCPNYPHIVNFTCDGPLPQSVGCVQAGNTRSGEVNATGYILYKNGPITRECLLRGRCWWQVPHSC